MILFKKGNLYIFITLLLLLSIIYIQHILHKFICLFDFYLISQPCLADYLLVKLTNIIFYCFHALSLKWCKYILIRTKCRFTKTFYQTAANGTLNQIKVRVASHLIPYSGHRTDTHPHVSRIFYHQSVYT